MSCPGINLNVEKFKWKKYKIADPISISEHVAKHAGKCAPPLRLDIKSAPLLLDMARTDNCREARRPSAHNLFRQRAKPSARCLPTQAHGRVFKRRHRAAIFISDHLIESPSPTGKATAVNFRPRPRIPHCGFYFLYTPTPHPRGLAYQARAPRYQPTRQ
jgi:hypothetical protein